MQFSRYVVRPAAVLPVLALLAGFALPLRAQAPNPAAAAPDPSKPNLITLDVVATDKTEHPIRGLGQQDFTVLDNGQPRPIVGFRAIDTSTSPGAVRVLIVVDMVNNNLQEVPRQREQLGEYLKQDNGKLNFPTSIAVLTEDGVKMMQGYSLDGNQLLAAFDKIPNSIRVVGRDAGFYGAAERVEESIREVQEIAAYEATQPGRKLVFLISPGWAMLPNAGIQETDHQRQWVFNTIVQTSTLLREAHIALYTLDPFMLGRTDPFYYQGYRKPVKKVNDAEYPYLAQQLFAEHSGGRVMLQGHDIVGEINSALHDAGAYYQITFEAPVADAPNEYHDLKVQTAKPDVTLRTNSGYYARPQPVGGKTTSPSKVPAPSMGMR